MLNLLGTKTEQNLREAFAGESMAHLKYSLYAERAKKDGYMQIADIFSETAHNEREHAEIWFKYLHDGQMPATLPNLGDAAEGEMYEWTTMYERMAKEAAEEGFSEISALFKLVAQVEKQHETRYRAFIENIEKGRVFSREEDVIWVCKNCGHVYIGETAPTVCPVCKVEQGYFMLKPTNY